MKNLEIKLTGDIDHHCAAGYKKSIDDALARQKPERLILDFSKVSLMDSSGIGLMIGRYKKMKAVGGVMAVKNLSPHMDRIFKLAGLYQIIEKIK